MIFVGYFGLQFSYHLGGGTPQKLTWNLEMVVSNRNLLFQGSIFRFHVCFGGCNSNIFGGIFTSKIKEMIQFDERAYFSDGVRWFNHQPVIFFHLAICDLP